MAAATRTSIAVEFTSGPNSDLVRATGSHDGPPQRTPSPTERSMRATRQRPTWKMHRISRRNLCGATEIRKVSARKLRLYSTLRVIPARIEKQAFDRLPTLSGQFDRAGLPMLSPTFGSFGECLAKEADLRQKSPAGGAHTSVDSQCPAFATR